MHTGLYSQSGFNPDNREVNLPFTSNMINPYGYYEAIENIKWKPVYTGKNEICLLPGERSGGWRYMMLDGKVLQLSPEIKKIWEIRNRLDYPESAVYDPSSGNIYVSNYHAETEGYISVISADGNIIDKKFVSGLMRPTGIIISKNRIFVVERKNIVEIDKERGEIIRRYPIPGCRFPNDIACDDDGTLYISDSGASRIYSLFNGDVTILTEGDKISYPNGLECSDGYLYAGCSGDASIRRINPGTGEVTVLARVEQGSVMDGLQALGNGELLFSDYNGRLFYLNKEGIVNELINTVSSKINLADFEYIKDRKMLIIPGLYSNVLSAYKTDL